MANAHDALAEDGAHESAGPCITEPLPKSAWANLGGTNGPSYSESPGSVSFANVMSEQLADALMEDELGVGYLSLDTPATAATSSIIDDHASFDLDTSNDEALAILLQAQMDKEYNEHIANEERKANQNSKVKLSYDKYRTDGKFVSDSTDEDSTDELENDAIEPSKEFLHIPSGKGYTVFGNTIVTKHDGEICGRRNVARMEDSFPTEFYSGDARGMDLQLPNKIYNSLKKHAYSEQKRGQRLHEAKEHYTAEHALDEKTRLLLHRLVNRGVLASVNGVVSVGKESVVIHADGGDAVPLDDSVNTGIELPENVIIPSECVVKVFKTTLNEFRRREKYIKDDYRFKDRFKKLNPRKMIHMWAEKEMHNLLRIHDAGILCPEVVLLKKHILVMSFIGTDQRPAPKLKDAVLSHSQKKSVYSQVIRIMKTLYQDCKLVHSDLSEYNLLWSNEQVWVIDVSQAVEPNHPHGLEFLLRDCKNIVRFFKHRHMEDVIEPMHLFNEVSGLGLCTDDETTFLFELERLQQTAEQHSHQTLDKSTALLEP